MERHGAEGGALPLADAVAYALGEADPFGAALTVDDRHQVGSPAAIATAKARTIALPSTITPTRRRGRQAAVEEGANGREQGLPGERGEERAEDEGRLLRRSVPGRRQAQDEGREVGHRHRVQEGDANEDSVRARGRAASLGRLDVGADGGAVGAGPRGGSGPQAQQPVHGDGHEDRHGEEPERRLERGQDGSQRGPEEPPRRRRRSRRRWRRPAPAAAARRKPRRSPVSMMRMAIAPTGIAIPIPPRRRPGTPWIIGEP